MPAGQLRDVLGWFNQGECQQRYEAPVKGPFVDLRSSSLGLGHQFHPEMLNQRANAAPSSTKSHELIPCAGCVVCLSEALI